MSEINLNILKEVVFAQLKEEKLDNVLDDKSFSANLKQYKALESSHSVLREDVDSQLRFISMLNQLAILADKMADAKKRDLDKNKQEEYKDKFEKVQKAILNSIDIPDDFVQLLQVAASGGIDALHQVAVWARKTAKEMRNDEELNAKIEKLQDQELKLQSLGRAAFKDANHAQENFDRYSILKKSFRTNASEEEYRMQLMRLERSRKMEVE